MSIDRLWSRVRTGKAGLYCVLMLALDLLLAARQTSQAAVQDPYLLRFLMSSGAGGIAVFLAALIAGGVAWRNANKASLDAQVKAKDERVKATIEQSLTRARAAAEDEQVRQDRFWDTLTWVYDRAFTERETFRLSPGVTIALLHALGAEAETDMEAATVAYLMDLGRDRTGERQGQ